MTKIPQRFDAIPGVRIYHRRRSSDSVWPLRGADGLTFAERQEKANGAKTS